MCEKPWEQLGNSFVQHYYSLFDSDRAQLGSIYVSLKKIMTHNCVYWLGNSQWQLCYNAVLFIHRLNSHALPGKDNSSKEKVQLLRNLL